MNKFITVSKNVDNDISIINIHNNVCLNLVQKFQKMLMKWMHLYMAFRGILDKKNFLND